MEFVPFPQQRAAIAAPPGPVLVLAGPGAGKTFCLIGRIEHLVRNMGFAPERICAVTFTNKAAEEVAVRLSRRLGGRADDVTRGTLHALCLGILREHPVTVGLRRGFGVADEDYQYLLLRRLGVSLKRRRQLLTLFGRHRLQAYQLTEGDEALFDSYISMLRQRNLVDFDDIIALTAELFRREPAIADQVVARWDYILVDEFQDLDASQYAILKRLAEGHRNIFAVGDDEQSIFSWRGSDPRILWRFGTDFGVEPIVLDRNCRCSRQIFEVARRLMKANPMLFDKAIVAERDSEFDVEAHAFADEEAEATWILERLTEDRRASGRSWGDYALLYRQHRVGRFLENRLVAADIPCRLVRGRSLLDDHVIAYVVASLRLMSAPDDPLAMEAFAERMLPRAMLAEVRALAGSRTEDLPTALRAFGRAHARDHPDTKKAWRFVYHVENLRALYESHTALGSLIEELLSQRVKPFENRLEERYDELSDPQDFPGAQELAAGLGAAVAGAGRVWIEARGGVEIALRGMLLSAELPVSIEYLTDEARPEPHDLVLTSTGERPVATTLFKALQLIHSRDFGDVFRDYVAFDLETTDLDPASCEIIEIGAARVREGEIVETFRKMVRPEGPISAQASEIHGYSEADVRGAQRFEEVWPEFRAFVGDDTLVAHNGHRFDVPVLRRLAGGFAELDDLVFYDTLPLARSLYRESARLVDLAQRFDIEAGQAHHALDDAVTLAHVFRGLNRQKRIRARKAALVNLIDHLGLGLALEPRRALTDEDRLLLELATAYTLGRYSDCLDFYAAERDRVITLEAPDQGQVVERLGGHALMERIRAERTPAERYPSAVARLQSLIDVSEADSLEESVHTFLDRVALSTSEGVEADPHRVSLLTLHSTKGLEFSRVFVVGVEDYQIPGYYAVRENRTDEIEEARRLLYVGMSRAKDRLVLTRADQRRGQDSGGSLFLGEIELTPVRS